MLSLARRLFKTTPHYPETWNANGQNALAKKIHIKIKFVNHSNIINPPVIFVYLLLIYLLLIGERQLFNNVAM